MRPTIRLNARLALAVTLIGIALLAFGSVRAIPYTAPGQIVLSVFAGAVLLFLGSVELALTFALHPELLDATAAAPGRLARLVRRTALGAPVHTGALAQHRWLRWGLVAVCVAVAVAALLLVASDVWAYKTLSWAIPRGRARFIY